MNMQATAAAITAVANQPSTFSPGPIVKTSMAGG
jgi:hypothetical protein